MNTINLNVLTNAIKTIFLFGILTTAFIVSRTSLIAHQQMSYAIEIDLTLTLPFAYLFFIRKTSVSKLTVIPVFIFGLFFASYILPQGNSLLYFLKLTVFPALEIGVLGFAGYAIFKARKTFQSLKKQNFDAMENLRQTFADVFPSPALGKAAAFEIAVFYYAFFRWRGEKSSENSFTYHRETGVLALLSIFVFLILAETVALHFVIANWSAVAAWVLTALSAYFAFQIFALAKAVLFRPIRLQENEICLRCGIIGDARIDYFTIEKVEIIQQQFPPNPDTIKMTAAGKLAAPNVKITLRDAGIFNGFYGFEKKIKTILLAVDESERFKTAIENKLTNFR